MAIDWRSAASAVGALANVPLFAETAAGIARDSVSRAAMSSPISHDGRISPARRSSSSTDSVPARQTEGCDPGTMLALWAIAFVTFARVREG
jgi:hypothetical protein